MVRVQMRGGIYAHLEFLSYGSYHECLHIPREAVFMHELWLVSSDSN